jgi:stalled ribosome alternative rescue factor ArfA
MFRCVFGFFRAGFSLVTDELLRQEQEKRKTPKRSRQAKEQRGGS